MKKFIFYLVPFISLFSKAYTEEQVHFPVGKDINLMGYVSKPKGKKKFPVLIMQMGHGPGTTDSKTRSYNPFAETARAIAGQGFLVLRFDKRGTGYNSENGSYADGKFSDYVSDLKAAIRAMQLRKDVDPNEIYLLGHSLGGPVVSIVANEISEVKGIILSASPGRNYDEFNYEQMVYFYKWGQDLSEEALEKELKNIKRANHLIGQPEIFCKEFPSDCEQKNNTYYLYGQNKDFWAEIVKLDPLKELTLLKCQVFAIHGTSDWVISSDNDGGPIAELMSKNKKFSNKFLNGLDHFLLKTNSKETSFQTFKSGLKGEDVKIHPELIPEITTTLKTWLNK